MCFAIPFLLGKSHWNRFGWTNVLTHDLIAATSLPSPSYSTGSLLDINVITCRNLPDIIEIFYSMNILIIIDRHSTLLQLRKFHWNGLQMNPLSVELTWPNTVLMIHGSAAKFRFVALWATTRGQFAYGKEK